MPLKQPFNHIKCQKRQNEKAEVIKEKKKSHLTIRSAQKCGGKRLINEKQENGDAKIVINRH